MLTTACTAHSGPRAASEAPLPLEGPTWTLVELGGHPVSAGRDGRLPYLQLATEDRQLRGYGGCDRLTGSYETKGTVLRFPSLAMTRMACPDTMQLEQAFVMTLEATDHFRIEGGTLELIAAGKARARLRVVGP